MLLPYGRLQRRPVVGLHGQHPLGGGAHGVGEGAVARVRAGDDDTQSRLGGDTDEGGAARGGWFDHENARGVRQGG